MKRDNILSCGQSLSVCSNEGLRNETSYATNALFAQTYYSICFRLRSSQDHHSSFSLVVAFCLITRSLLRSTIENELIRLGLVTIATTSASTSSSLSTEVTTVVYEGTGLFGSSQGFFEVLVFKMHTLLHV